MITILIWADKRLQAPQKSIVRAERAPAASALDERRGDRVSDIGSIANRLDRPVNTAYDHVLGPDNAEITLLEYGSYDCPHCRAANERISQVRDQFGDRLRYVFRHRPITGSSLARRAAELAEHSPKEFWDAHVALMTRSAALSEDDLAAVSARLGVDRESSAA